VTPVQHQFANGLRAVVLPRPDLLSACVSVYVQAGSVHESRRLNGISHVIEHMVFKGTTTRDARQINLDAERLGAEVDAYTDKDHTAFHLRGLAEHALRFVPLLADLLVHATFPARVRRRRRRSGVHGLQAL
jgi:predicted Zn-dependent peptidase